MSLITTLADNISNGMFADRKTITEAYEYGAKIARACGPNEIGVLTAIHVLMNTIAKTLKEIDTTDELVAALERIALDITCDGPECNWCKIGEHPPTTGAIIAKEVIAKTKEA
jgi:hypothetical protein